MGEKGQAAGGAATNAAQAGASAEGATTIAAQVGAPAGAPGVAAVPGGGAPGGERGQSTQGSLDDLENLQDSVNRQTKSQEVLSDFLKKQAETANGVQTNIK